MTKPYYAPLWEKVKPLWVQPGEYFWLDVHGTYG
jgi:hypothetical protein